MLTALLVLNVRVGPYTVSVAMSGFKEQKQQAVDVALRRERTVDFKLPIATVAKRSTCARAEPANRFSRAGTADNISNAVKESLPTIAQPDRHRAHQPLFVAQGSGAGDGPQPVGGGNSYRTTLQIDGAVNNDLVRPRELRRHARRHRGNAADSASTPIQEIQLVVAP